MPVPVARQQRRQVCAYSRVQVSLLRVYVPYPPGGLYPDSLLQRDVCDAVQLEIACLRIERRVTEPRPAVCRQHHAVGLPFPDEQGRRRVIRVGNLWRGGLPRGLFRPVGLAPKSGLLAVDEQHTPVPFPP